MLEEVRRTTPERNYPLDVTQLWTCFKILNYGHVSKYLTIDISQGSQLWTSFKQGNRRRLSSLSKLPSFSQHYVKAKAGEYFHLQTHFGSP